MNDYERINKIADDINVITLKTRKDSYEDNINSVNEYISKNFMDKQELIMLLNSAENSAFEDENFEVLSNIGLIREYLNVWVFN